MTEATLDSAREAPAALPTAGRQMVRIEPSSGWRALDLRELWRYRELAWTLAMRDVSVRYKQTALGVVWALLQPLVAMAIFTLFFGVLIKVPSDGLPYALLAYTGLVPWTFFANAASDASSSLVSNTTLISKVYFPRLVIPIASVLAGLVDLGIGLAILVVLVITFGITFGPGVLLVPVFIGLAVLAALSVGIWLSALDVQYRDVRYAIPFLIQVWMFATPVIYPASIVPEPYRALFGLNPMVGVVEGFRWALLEQSAPPFGLVAVSTVVVAIALLTGLLYFRRMERTFADVI